MSEFSPDGSNTFYVVTKTSDIFVKALPTFQGKKVPVWTEDPIVPYEGNPEYVSLHVGTPAARNLLQHLASTPEVIALSFACQSEYPLDIKFLDKWLKYTRWDDAVKEEIRAHVQEMESMRTAQIPSMFRDSFSCNQRLLEIMGDVIDRESPHH